MEFGTLGCGETEIGIGMARNLFFSISESVYTEMIR
jgi:hypothetical protein